MADVIEETGTVTIVGQTTVPKNVRIALGIEFGGKIAYRVEAGLVTVCSTGPQKHDPVFGAFVKLIEKDIVTDQNLRDLPATVTTVLRRALKHAPTNLGKSFRGDVAL